MKFFAKRFIFDSFRLSSFALKRNLYSNLHEWQAKTFLASKYALPIQTFEIVDNVKQTNDALAKLRQKNIKSFVIKAQVKCGGRGKGTFSNGFKKGVHIIGYDDPVKIAHIIHSMLGHYLVTPQTGIHGEFCEKVMICQSYEIDQERYLSFSIDNLNKKLLIMYNKCGGSSVEENELNESNPSMKKIYFDPDYQLTEYDLSMICNDLSFSHKYHNYIKNCIAKLFHVFVTNKLSLLEINPFAIAKEIDSIMCFDCKISVDDPKNFKQPNLLEDDKDKLHDFGGSIACFANGAGLCMATMDCINQTGSSVSVFYDVGGKSDKNAFKNAILNSLHSKAIVLNIFGGIVDCYQIVSDLTATLPKNYSNVFVSLRGNNSDNAAYHLETRGIKYFDDITKAIKAAVKCDTFLKQETPSIASWT